MGLNSKIIQSKDLCSTCYSIIDRVFSVQGWPEKIAKPGTPTGFTYTGKVIIPDVYTNDNKLIEQIEYWITRSTNSWYPDDCISDVMGIPLWPHCRPISPQNQCTKKINGSYLRQTAISFIAQVLEFYRGAALRLASHGCIYVPFGDNPTRLGSYYYFSIKKPLLIRATCISKPKYNNSYTLPKPCLNCLQNTGPGTYNTPSISSLSNKTSKMSLDPTWGSTPIFINPPTWTPPTWGNPIGNDPCGGRCKPAIVGNGGSCSCCCNQVMPPPDNPTPPPVLCTNPITCGVPSNPEDCDIWWPNPSLSSVFNREFFDFYPTEKSCIPKDPPIKTPPSVPIRPKPPVAKPKPYPQNPIVEIPIRPPTVSEPFPPKVPYVMPRPPQRQEPQWSSPNGLGTNSFIKI